MTETPLLIRAACASEHRALEDLQRRASLANPGDREAIQADPGAIELPLAQIVDGRVFVAEIHGAVAGFAVVLPNDDGSAELDGLFIEPEAWRRGIGKALVAHCVELSRRQGASALHVTGNPHAGSFYLRCGFEANGTVAVRFGRAERFRRVF